MSFIIKRDFNDIVEENADFVKAIVRKFVKDPETVKDLTQEIFLRAYMNYERYTEDGKIRAWLSVIANNMLKGHYRAEQYQTNYVVLSPIEYISAELLPPANMPEDIVIQQDLLDKITKIINSLPEKQRAIIIYSCFYGYSEKEIASIQDITVSAVKSAKYFGLQKVRKLIGTDYYEVGAGKKHKLNKFGRYRMIKCYTFDNGNGNGKFIEHTELKRDSVIELITPSQKEIKEVAGFMKDSGFGALDENMIEALVNGDFEKFKNMWPAAKFNDKLNVLIVEVDYIIISHDGKNDEHKELVKAISTIFEMLAVPGYINLDYADVCKVISGAKQFMPEQAAAKAKTNPTPLKMRWRRPSCWQIILIKRKA